MQLKYDLLFWHQELTEEQILAYFGYSSSDDSVSSQDVIDTQPQNGEIEINLDCGTEFSHNSAKKSSEQPGCSIGSNPKKQSRRRRRSKSRV